MGEDGGVEGGVGGDFGGEKVKRWFFEFNKTLRGICIDTPTIAN